MTFVLRLGFLDRKREISFLLVFCVLFSFGRMRGEG